MLLKRNILEYLIIISCSGSVFCILLNYVTNISPITGIWFPLYTFLLFILSISLSFKFLRWILELNKPMKYDLDGLVKEYPYLRFLCCVLPQPQKKKKREYQEYDTNELSVITTVLERKLVSSWYVPYISEEIGFPFACKQMLDQIIGKCFQICNEIESKDVFVDMCSILVTHLKEYKKALKRHEKSPTSTVASLYKKSHIISNPESKIDSAEHCTNVLRIVLKELVPWELWDTPHSELLVRILSKKLNNFIESTLADPAWLNEKLLTILNVKEPEENVEETNVEKKDAVEVIATKEEIIPEPVIEKTTVESALTTLITNTTAPILQRTINEQVIEKNDVPETINIVEETPLMITEPVDIKSSPVMRQRRGRQGRNEVKIYDRIIEGSVKTWETDIDLQCISLGQDLLASLDGEITLSRLWGQDADAEGSPNPPRGKSPQPLWFGEEDTLDIELAEASPHKEPRKDHSPKPADALLKDLQTTVHHAKTKIGDLQVSNVNLDVPRKQYSGDEAAGMMEGLLDFGIAGLKKGLRFTGLSDDTQEKSPSHQKHAERSSPPEASKAKPKEPEPKENMSTVVLREDNGTSIPPLLKQQRVISQDSLPSQAKSIPLKEVPPPLLPLSDSPEPEYEEAADLSTSIAKLRCLLQRADTSPKGEEAWWDNSRSQRPIDTATLADEYDMTERSASPEQAARDNNMQRLDKLFQRTVTGVFNSLKTAVGAEGEEPRPDHDWTYVTTSIELSVCVSVAKLVGARRARGRVDAALDPLLQHTPKKPACLLQPEDFEECVWSLGGAWGAGAALAAAAGLGRSAHAHRAAALLAADLGEALIGACLEELSAWLRAQVFAVFRKMADDDVTTKDKHAPRHFDVEKTCDVLMERLPAALQLFGEDTLRQAVRLTVSSLSHAHINRDVAFRLVDTLAVHFKKSAALRNPSFDAN